MCCSTKLDKVSNECIKENLEVMNLVGEMKENRLKWFGRAERRNNDEIVKNMDKIRVERNQGGIVQR